MSLQVSLQQALVADFAKLLQEALRDVLLREYSTYLVRAVQVRNHHDKVLFW
jgi:hypothetical protein